MPDVAAIYRRVRVMGIPRGEAVPNGNGSTAMPNLDATDPVEAAMIRRRVLLGQKMEEDTGNLLASQAALDARRLELEEAELELKQESMSAKLAAIRAEREKLTTSNGNGHTDHGLQALIAIMAEQNQRALADSKEAQQTVMAVLNEQLEASRKRAEERPVPGSVGIAERMRELGELRQVMAQLFPATPPADGMAPHQMLELRRMELDVEFQRHKLAEESAERVRRLALEETRHQRDYELRQAQAAAEHQRNERIGNLIEQLGPSALAAFAQRFGAEGIGGPSSGPSQQSYQMVRCQGCGGEFAVKPGATSALCSHCGLFHSANGQQEQAAPPPQQPQQQAAPPPAHQPELEVIPGAVSTPA